MSLRILFAADVPEDPSSGAAGTEYQTIEALRRRGHEVETVWASDMRRRIQHGNLHYLLELPSAYRRAIANRCARVRFDVIHVNQGHCYLAAREHLRSRRPGVFVCRSHGLDDHMERVLAPWRRRLALPRPPLPKALASAALSRLLQRHDRLAYQLASGVLVSSSLDESYLTLDMGVPASRVGRIAQAPAEAFVSTPAPPMNEERLRRLLHVGGFAYWKGVHAVAQAVDTLLAEDASLSMTWLCRREEHPNVLALLSPAAQSRVTLLDWVTQDELVEVYDQHGLFLAPSLFEGFGKVFLEAMARGLCVIGTPTGGMKDIIEPGRNGMLVGFHDPAGIAKAVHSLRSSRRLAADMSETAARTGRQYSWDRMASEVEAFYRRLISLGPRVSIR